MDAVKVYALAKFIAERKDLKDTFSNETSLNLAKISLSIDPIVIGLEKKLLELAKNHTKKNDETGEFELDQEAYKEESLPSFYEQVNPVIPKKLTLSFQEGKSLTIDEMRVFLNVRGDKLSVI